MKIFSKGLLVAVLGLGMALPAVADAGYNRDRDRSYNQHKRIEEGIRSGELTREEVRILRREQRKIGQMRRDFLRDGRITKWERKVLVNNLNRASKHIYRLRRNNQRAYYRYRPQHRYSSPLLGQYSSDSDRFRRRDNRNNWRY